MAGRFSGMLFASLALSGVGLAASIGSAQAGVVWSEDWNPANFSLNGTVTDTLIGNTTDRIGWSPVSYNVFGSTGPADQHGWTFEGSDFLVINGSGQGALYLNECCNPGVTGSGGATASTSITGLIKGQSYHVDFTFWGDNRPNSDFPGFYNLDVTLGSTQTTYTESDSLAGTLAGYSETLSFVATGPIETLEFAQFSSGNSQQSPIVGDIVVSAPEPSTWAMLLLGFVGLGFVGYRRSRGVTFG